MHYSCAPPFFRPSDVLKGSRVHTFGRSEPSEKTFGFQKAAFKRNDRPRRDHSPHLAGPPPDALSMAYLASRCGHPNPHRQEVAAANPANKPPSPTPPTSRRPPPRQQAAVAHPMPPRTPPRSRRPPPANKSPLPLPAEVVPSTLSRRRRPGARDVRGEFPESSQSRFEIANVRIRGLRECLSQAILGH